MRIPTIKYTGESGEIYELEAGVSAYSNGRPLIELWYRGERFAEVTVNMPDSPLAYGEVHVKNWSENTNLYHALIREAWLFPTTKSVRSGFVHVPVCRLGGALWKYVDSQLNLPYYPGEA